MKVVVAIPAFDEEATLPGVIREIPRAIAGVDEVAVIVIDDGSRDRTSEVAREAGADQVVRFAGRRGLAAAWQAGIHAALVAGADVVVGTDADGQYPGDAIAALVAPLVEGRADIAIGDRRPGKIAHFSLGKRLLQRLGSAAVRIATGTEVPDATSGFRALSREAALRLHVLTDFSYTVETIAQAAARRLCIVSVPIEARATARPSRLARGSTHFVLRQAATLVRVTVRYRALELFSILGASSLGAGVAIGARFLVYFEKGEGVGHVQSLILAATLILSGLGLGMVGLIIDLLSTNRRLAEEALERLKRVELASPAKSGSTGQSP